MPRVFSEEDYEDFQIIPGSRHVHYGIDLCPVCGQEVAIVGKTTDGRLIGGCNDAFTREEWYDR